MVVRMSREDRLKHAIAEAAKSERIYRSHREWNEHKRGAAEGLEFWTDRIAYLESLASGWDRSDPARLNGPNRPPARSSSAPLPA